VIFMPTETSSVMASVGAFKEVFAQTGETEDKNNNNRLASQGRTPRELEK
jgi:hypothetical protein